MVTRIFLCNEQTEPEIRDFIREAIADISEEEEDIVTWNCGNIQTLKVGDCAYFKRIGSASQGYFASGTVVPADREYQLKQRSPIHSHNHRSPLKKINQTAIAYPQKVKVKIA